MDDGQEHDQYEERLKEVFNSFDSSGCGSLNPEELSDLCQSLHLDDATPVLLQTLLQSQDHLTARVDFDQFKNALILVLSASFASPQAEEEPLPKPDSPEIQPKFVKGSKRYGRRSTPEFMEPVLDLSEVADINPADEEDLEDSYDSAVPRKRERWNANETSPEEYEAEGQMHLWNPDEPSTPRGSVAPLSSCLEERLHDACEELAITLDGCAGHTELLALCEHLGLELSGDVLLRLAGDGVMNVQEFVSMVVSHSKPPTPSASTPYRQLKRHHSTQPFDEGGRRISALTSTIGMRLFSVLDDGTGYTPAEQILDTWIEEGIENSAEILQALNFDLDEKLSLTDLTVALENELLCTKNGIHQAALASFKAEIRHLLERIDQEIGEKEKIRSDLEKAEKQKNQLATEVDEHHSAIEHKNNLNLRKLEQEHREKLAAVRSELMKEMDQIHQQAGLQREELEAEMEKIREDESFLRDHLSISVKENRRLEMELLDSNEKLSEAQSLITKLQTSVDNIMKNKFGDLDPGSADFLIQEERMKQLRNSYEAQCRELQDRIDELQSELQEFHTLGRHLEPCHKTLSEELESKSPGMESDPGIGSEDAQPFSMSLEAEMMMEQLKVQHLQEMEDLRNQLESKMKEFDIMVEQQRATHEDQKAALTLRYQQEVQALKEEMANIQNNKQELLNQLEQVELKRIFLEQKQTKEQEDLQTQQEEEVANLREQLLEAHTLAADLEEQLKTLEAEQEETNENLLTQMEELRNQYAMEISKLKEEQAKQLETRLVEERKKLQQQKAELERRLLDKWEGDKKVLLESHEDELKAQLEEAKLRFDKQREEVVKSLTEQWQKERAQLDEQNTESLQMLLEEEMLRLVREQDDKERVLRQQWESERARLQEHHEKLLLDRILEERLQLQNQFEQREKRLKEEWEKERLQLEEDYEGLIQDRLNEEREKLETEKEEEEMRIEGLITEERARLEESHRDAVKQLSVKHAEERDALTATLDKLREDIAREREEVELSFTQRIREVEDRFSGDQEYVAERFQADILKLEQHYQSELKALSESHIVQKLHWEAELQEALESAQERESATEEAARMERDELKQEWERESRELESVHRENIQALIIENKQLQNELDDVMSKAQRKEIKLSMQLNELHNRLQEKHELLSQSESKALQIERLLNQSVEDFRQERADLEAKYKETLGHLAETAPLLTERDDLKRKVKELEMLLKQVVEDFRLEREELQENLSAFEQRFKDDQEDDGEALRTERDALKMKITELEIRLDQLMVSGISELPYTVNKGFDDINVDEDARDEWMDAMGEATEAPDDEGCDDVDIFPDHMLEDISPEHGQPRLPDARLNPKSPDSYLYVENKAVSAEIRCEPISSLRAFGDGENKVVFESCEEESKPQNVPAVNCGSCFHAEEQHHETVVVALTLQESGDLGEHCVEDAEADCLPVNSHDNQEVGTLPEHSATGIKAEMHDGCSHECSLLKLHALYNTATEENVLLHEKIALLKQKTDLLEDLVAHHSEKIKTGHQALEENYNLKVQMLVLMEHVKELEMKALEMTDLQIRYEDCKCENVKLKEQNGELEKRAWSLEGRMNVVSDFQEQHVSLVDEISRMRGENTNLFLLLSELERQEDAKRRGIHTDEALLLEEEEPAGMRLGDCCEEFEKQNGKLRRAITELQDKSQTLNETTQAHRSEASRLAGENVVLRKKIAALKEGDLKEAQDELIQTLEYLKTEKFAAQKAADHFKNEISELRLQSQLLESENGLLTEKNSQNFNVMESLQQQLAELVKEKAEEKNKMAACVLALEAELTKALEDSAQLEGRNIQLSQQLSDLREKGVRMDSSRLSHLVEERNGVDKETAGLHNQLTKSQEKVRTGDENLTATSYQSTRLKSDLWVLQQERDSLKHEVAVLQKQLQNANDKNHILEMALHSSGLQNQSKKLYREEMSRLMGQEQQLLRQENERLQAEVRSMKSELTQSREKLRQQDASILPQNKRKQPSQSSLLKALEQENASLKQKLEAKREVAKGYNAEQSHTQLESLQQENEALKAQMARLSSQLMETFQAQLAGLLPPSPHRVPRGQHRGEDPDNMQDERERKMKTMEERMREIELSLHNVKLLLKEKVAQLKDQLHKNGKADVLINDLYVENAQLLQALEITEQRQKIAEKKNYLLEEKISSLNKIVRDLNPSPLPYSYK